MKMSSIQNSTRVGAHRKLAVTNPPPATQPHSAVEVVALSSHDRIPSSRFPPLAPELPSHGDSFEEVAALSISSLGDPDGFREFRSQYPLVISSFVSEIGEISGDRIG